MSASLQKTVDRLKAQVVNDLGALPVLPSSTRASAHTGRHSDSAMATMLALGANPMYADQIRHAHASEIEHRKVLAALEGDCWHVSIPLLERASRSLVVVLIERASRPQPNGETSTTVRQLQDVALLIAKLEALSDLAYDLGIGARHSSYVDTTLERMQRGFEEECRGLSQRNAGVLKRVYERLAEQVSVVHRLFWDLADKTRVWDLDAHHDYRGDYAGLIEAAMDAALLLEANFEDRVFGPREADGDEGVRA